MKSVFCAANETKKRTLLFIIFLYLHKCVKKH